jgi:cell division septal protein FtsQ
MAKTSARTRRRRFYIASLLVLIGLCYGGYRVFKYHLFVLKNVVIRENHFQDTAPILALLSQHKGENVLWLRWVTGEDLILKKFPKIDSVRLTVTLPYTLNVILTEKEPWLVFVGETGNIVIAKDGTILSDGSQDTALPEKGNLLIIRGLPASLFDNAQLSEVVLAKLRIIVDKIRYHFPDAALQLDCTGLDFASEFEGLDDIVLLRDDTLPVRLGSLVQLEEKLILLKKFFWHYSKEIDPPPLEYIDLRAKGKVIVKYAENG